MRKESEIQAENMARFSKVPLTQEQKDLYVTLREVDSGLTDQRLLAKVMGITGDKNLELFKGAYPNIFEEEIE